MRNLDAMLDIAYLIELQRPLRKCRSLGEFTTLVNEYNGAVCSLQKFFDEYSLLIQSLAITFDYEYFNAHKVENLEQWFNKQFDKGDQSDEPGK